MKKRTYLAITSTGLLVGLVLSCSLAIAQNEEILTENTSRYAGGGRWDWTVFIKASPDVLKNIRYVEYKLPSTYNEPNVKVYSIREQSKPFAFKSNGWRTFDIPIRVVFKNGRTQTLRHKLIFEGSP